MPTAMTALPPPSRSTVPQDCNRDVLIHEAQLLELLAKTLESTQSFVAKYHTTTEQLVDLANEAKPKMLVIYPYDPLSAGDCASEAPSSQKWSECLYASPEILWGEINSRYSGKFVIG
jgi:ribonuclease BN (tRNA processing enzyme)